MKSLLNMQIVIHSYLFASDLLEREPQGNLAVLRWLS